MIKKNLDFTVENENAADGLGNFIMRHALTGSELPSHVKLVCEVIIQPGEECIIHEHKGDSELYYIVSGNAKYTGKEGTSYLEKGDVTCCYDGETHAIKCSGDEPLLFLAFITYTK